MKDSKIVLLGGTGLLGQSLQLEFKRKEFKNVYTCSREDLKTANHIQGDLLDTVLVQQLIDFKFDLIINLTGQITKPIDNCVLLNSVGMEHLIQVMQHSPNCKLIQISTVGVYGSCSFADENSKVNPETPYSVAKSKAEKLLMSQIKPTNVVVFRLSNLYGEAQLKGVFAYLNRAASTDRVLDFNNDGSLVRFFMHASDCSSIVVEFVQNHIKEASGVYNIIGTDKYSVLELIQLFEKIKNLKFKVNLDSALPYDNVLHLSDAKIKSLFDYSPKMKIQSYLNKMKSYD